MGGLNWAGVKWSCCNKVEAIRHVALGLLAMEELPARKFPAIGHEKVPFLILVATVSFVTFLV